MAAIPREIVFQTARETPIYKGQAYKDEKHRTAYYHVTATHEPQAPRYYLAYTVYQMIDGRPYWLLRRLPVPRNIPKPTPFEALAQLGRLAKVYHWELVRQYKNG